MTTYSVVPADMGHLRFIADRMRLADRMEVWASSRFRPWEALYLSYQVSRDTKIGMADGEPKCAWGFAPKNTMVSEVARPWMLSVEGIEKFARPLMRMSKIEVEKASEEFPFMANYVDARNSSAIKWIKWLGFTVHEAEPWGFDNIPFHWFTMGRK